MSSSVTPSSSEAAASLAFGRALTGLKDASRDIIKALTEMARNYERDHCEVVVKCLEESIQMVRPPRFDLIFSSTTTFTTMTSTFSTSTTGYTTTTAPSFPWSSFVIVELLPPPRPPPWPTPAQPPLISSALTPLLSPPPPLLSSPTSHYCRLHQYYCLLLATAIICTTF